MGVSVPVHRADQSAGSSPAGAPGDVQDRVDHGQGRLAVGPLAVPVLPQQARPLAPGRAEDLGRYHREPGVAE